MPSIIWLTDRSRYEECSLHEEWRPYLRGIYEVSSCGRVRRAQRAGSYRGKVGRCLKFYLGGRTKRICVVLALEGRKHCIVARMVAAAFIGPCPAGKEVNHIDGNKYNDHADNLEYVTRAENAAHSKRLGLVASEERHGMAKLTVEAVRQIRAKAGHVMQKDLALEYGVSDATISRVVLRKDWQHV